MVPCMIQTKTPQDYKTAMGWTNGPALALGLGLGVSCSIPRSQNIFSWTMWKSPLGVPLEEGGGDHVGGPIGGSDLETPARWCRSVSFLPCPPLCDMGQLGTPLGFLLNQLWSACGRVWCECVQQQALGRQAASVHCCLETIE